MTDWLTANTALILVIVLVSFTSVVTLRVPRASSCAVHVKRNCSLQWILRCARNFAWRSRIDDNDGRKYSFSGAFGILEWRHLENFCWGENLRIFTTCLGLYIDWTSHARILAWQRICYGRTDRQTPRGKMVIISSHRFAIIGDAQQKCNPLFILRFYR